MEGAIMGRPRKENNFKHTCKKCKEIFITNHRFGKICSKCNTNPIHKPDVLCVICKKETSPMSLFFKGSLICSKCRKELFNYEKTEIKD